MKHYCESRYSIPSFVDMRKFRNFRNRIFHCLLSRLFHPRLRRAAQCYGLWIFGVCDFESVPFLYVHRQVFFKKNRTIFSREKTAIFFYRINLGKISPANFKRESSAASFLNKVSCDESIVVLNLNCRRLFFFFD